MHSGKFIIALGFFSLFICVESIAQQPLAYRFSEKEYFEAVELMNKEKYEAAREKFNTLIEDVSDTYTEIQVNAEYYRAVCALTLFHKDGEYLLSNFIKRHPESNWVGSAYFQLGQYNFSRRRYEDAIAWFRKVDVRDLSADQKTEFYFKKGFSEYSEGDLKAASSSFYLIKDVQGEYYSPANYYYGHIAYEEGNYQTALNSFELIEEDENFGPIIPYYKAQIYYLQGKYDELLAYAPPLLEAGDAKRSDEIARLIGDAHYKKEQYAEAVPYLEQYAKSNYNLPREDSYQLGYAYYRSGNYTAALERFSKVTGAEDELAQIATYQMADSYVQLDQKTYARNAFKLASQMTYDRQVTEDALFNYAKLAYELSFDPFHEAIRAFEEYISTYPNSDRKDEAYEFLLKVYLTTKNYQAALNALDKIKNKDVRMRAAYQQSAYNRAVELMQQGNNEEAEEYFHKSTTYSEDPKTSAMAEYWIGELYFKEGEYQKAKAAYEKFLSSPSAYSTPFYNDANYNIGYTLFKQDQYGNAATYFRKYTTADKTSAKKKNDAYLRIGDAYLVAKDYSNAIKNYESAAGINALNGDYAIYQVARSHGFRDDYSQKVNSLKELLQKYPDSPYAVAAKYEMGDSYFSMDQLDNALVSFNDVINNYPSSAYKKKSLLKKGLILYRQNQYDEAIAAFKTVMKDFATDEDSKEAQATLQNIYVDLGKVDEYSEWLAGLPNYNVSTSELDSLTYQSAENLYSNDNCEKAVPAFNNYINKFANGAFALNANFYKAECEFKAGNFDAALAGYNYAISQPVNKFSEASYLGAASINYKNKNYQQALQNYVNLEKVAEFSTNVLEAHIGQMRAHFYLGNYSLGLPYAQLVVNNDKSPEAIAREARLMLAKMHMSEGNKDKALEQYSWLSNNTGGKEGAEATFRLAEIKYVEQDYKGAEAMVFDLLQKFPSQEFWEIKSFLLLSDVYVGMKDYFQAKATLQSIIDNVQDEVIKGEAREKLKAIDVLENPPPPAEEEEFDEEEGFFEGEEAPEQNENIQNGQN